MRTEEGPCEDTARRRPLASQGERPQEKTPEASRTTRNTWLQWPQQTNTGGKETNLTEDPPAPWMDEGLGRAEAAAEGLKTPGCRELQGQRVLGCVGSSEGVGC